MANSPTYAYEPSTPSNVHYLEDVRATYSVLTNVEVTRTILGTLGASPHAVYALLETYCNREGKARPSIDRIAKETLLSESTVHRAMKKLEGAGWIVRTPAKNQFGFVNGMTYTLPYHTTPSDERGSMGGVIGGVTTSPTVTPKVSPQVKKEVTTTPALDQATSARLSELRQAYPAHRRGGNARELATLWAELSGTEQDEAIAGAKAWASSPEWAEEHGKYVPSITRFLSERRWESAPATIPSTGNTTVDLLRAMGI